MNWLEEVNKEDDRNNQVYSFHEYMEILEKNPRREIRTGCVYLKDMFDYFGKNERGGFNLFSRDHKESIPVYGQFRTQNLVYQNLKNFIEEGYANKFILLVGPNGSSKSSLVKRIMLGTEDYSLSDEGSLFTFSWVFPIDNYIKGSLGLGSSVKSKELQSFAKLDDQDVSAILGSELKDHPFLLIPLASRRKMIDEYLQDFPELADSIKKSFLYNGDLSKRNRMIFDALLKNYKGSYTEVYKHLRVERFHIKKRYSQGAVTIEPQMHVDAKLQQITMDKRLGSLPPSLQSLNLFSLNGEIILANRGILEYSDLLKRPLDAYKYLLTTMESRCINLQGILTELDIFFIGSSNEVHFSAFKQHPDFNSFKGRFNFIKVPYLLNYQDEMGIYKEQIQNIKDSCNFEPHALEALCLWSVMTRLRLTQSKNYKDKKTGEIVEKLNPLEKALYLADGKLPEKFNSEQKQRLKQNQDKVYYEFQDDSLYQGKFGISPREIKQIIYEISSKYNDVTFVEIIDYLKSISDKKMIYDFLNISAQGDYHNVNKFIAYLQDYCIDVFDNELRDSLGLVDDRSYEKYIKKYVVNINALLKGEKIKNTVTGKYEPSDMYFIKEFESNVKLKETPDKFRSHLISKLGAFYLDNPGVEIVYCDVFSDIVKRLQESFREEQRKMIATISNSLVFYQGTDEKNGKLAINKESKEMISNILENLTKKYGYSEKGALELMKIVIQKRYEPTKSK